MRKKYWIIIVGIFLFRVLLAFGSSHPDIRNHMDWGERFYQYGASGFYSPDANVWDYTWPNQPILTIYLYALIWRLFNLVFDVFWKINITISLFPSIIITLFENKLYEALLKLPSIIADFGIAYYLYRIFKDDKKEKLGKLAAVLFLTNPVVWYNSAVWGQTDAYINFFGLTSFYYLNKKQYFKSSLLMAISLLTKISLLIFAPIYLLVLIKQKADWKKVGISGFSAMVFALLLAIPFANGENPISFLWWLYTEKVLTQQLQVITANSFNIWAGLTGIHEQPHTLKFIIFSYQYWGYLLFGEFVIPVLYRIFKTKNKDDVWWMLAVISFSSFMLLTNMHERYLYPVFPYLTLLSVKYRKLMPILIITSLINLLNLYNFWWVPRVEIIVELMSGGDRIMPRILGFVMFGVYLLFYREVFRQAKSK